MAIHLLTGNDESLLRTAASSLIDDLVGDGDRAMMVDEFDGDEYELRAVVDAAQTPPFLTDKRVVVARGMGRFNAADLTGLLAYLENPLDSSDLVLLAGGGTLSPKLTPAIKKVGTVTATAVGSRASDRQEFVRDRLAEAGVRLDGPAQALLIDWLGENVSQLAFQIGRSITDRVSLSDSSQHFARLTAKKKSRHEYVRVAYHVHYYWDSVPRFSR